MPIESEQAAIVTPPRARADSVAMGDFEDLLRRHQAMVFSIALRYLGDSGRAEEVAQDVFLRLYGELRRIQSEEHAVAWLRRVTVHRAIDASRKPDHARTVDLAAGPEPAANEDGGDILMEESLRRMVASLPEKQRMALILRFQEDMDPTEIAGILGAPVATVKSDLRRGLALLREKANRRWGDER